MLDNNIDDAFNALLSLVNNEITPFIKTLQEGSSDNLSLLITTIVYKQSEIQNSIIALKDSIDTLSYTLKNTDYSHFHYSSKDIFNSDYIPFSKTYNTSSNILNNNGRIKLLKNKKYKLSASVALTSNEPIYALYSLYNHTTEKHIGSDGFNGSSSLQSNSTFKSTCYAYLELTEDTEISLSLYMYDGSFSISQSDLIIEEVF
ncbi:MAG: hypothetical protein GQ570_11230 [Helicobacteraceae bacterium]|nr:hypothetical protein [Helicobacteraceae bacterium]